MIVVVIMGVLATLAIVSVRSYITKSRSVEARSVIGSIAAAQRRFRSENMLYLNVSTNITTYYPTASPNATVYEWHRASGNNFANWELLAPDVKQPVQFGYATVAGLPGATLPAIGVPQSTAWPTPVEPWYIIQAIGDLDADGVQTVLAASSFGPNIAEVNAGE